MYLKLKMPGAKGVITIMGDLKRAEDIANKNVHIADTNLAEVQLKEYKMSVDLTKMPKNKKLVPTESSF